jgi:L-lactate dehydrogenase (cytochrome)
MSKKLEQCFNIDDLRKLAKNRLPAPIYEYLRGGADDEWSMQNNLDAFSRIQLLPRTMRDVRTIDTSTTVLGQTINMPLIMAPVGFVGMFHHHREIAAAKAGQNYGLPFSLATWGSATIEEVADATTGPKVLQLYLPNDRERAYALVDRAKASGYSAVCVTVDTVIPGNREGARRMGAPPASKMTAGSIASVLAHPRWLYHFVKSKPRPAASYFNHQPSGLEMFEAGPTANMSFDDISRLRDRWDGPLAVKGILSVEDAKLAVDHGATALIISNHGGRQLESVPAPVDLIASFVEAVGGRAEIIVDSGIRRGTDIIKALALGADACMIGRPYIYGLAAGGQAGVERSLAIFKEELERDMALLGATSIKAINNSYLFKQPY